MANLASCWIMFEETMKQVIEHFNLEGKVLKEINYANYEYIIVHSFVCKYLSIHDYNIFDAFEVHEDHKKTIMDFCVKKIKEIDYQFRFYFEGVWG